jgi:hypothetical protein
MSLSDTLTTILSGTGLVSLVGAATVFFRTRKLMQQRDKITEASVIEQLSGTVGDFAEGVRRDAQAQIDDTRRWARQQIDAAVDRAERAEARAVKAERAATEAQIASMQASASMRRLTTAILSPYATIDGLRTMVAPDGPAVNGRG